MTIKHNQQIQHNHFRKDWQRRVRCHFDQPGRKLRRRNARQVKAAAVAPRPVDKLRPVVRCPTVKYNMRIRAGRGFSLAELKAAGLSKQYARTVGISVDHRRANLSEESLKPNVERLKAYQERLIVFPRRNGQFKKTDSSKSDVDAYYKDSSNTTRNLASVLPIVDEQKANAVSEVSRNNLPKGETDAFKKLRIARSDARLVGVREKRAKAKAEEADSKKK